MKAGALRDHDLTVYQAMIASGERGVHLRITWGDQKELLFLGQEEIKELIAQLREAEFELQQP